MRYRVFLMFAGLALAACNSSDEPGPKVENEPQGDGGGNGNGDGDKTGSSDLKVSATLTAVEKETEEGSGLRGFIDISDQDGKEVYDAIVKINGISIPVVEDALSSFYAVRNAAIEGVTLGSSIEIVVERGSQRVDFKVECPRDVELKSPENGLKVAANQDVEFKWTGDVTQGDGASSVRIAPYNSVEKKFANIKPPPQHLSSNDPVTYTVPDRNNPDLDSWIATLAVRGKTTQTDAVLGACIYEFTRQLLPQD